MTVFIVTQTFPPQMGGMENVMASLAAHFARAGNSVTVLPDKPYISHQPYEIVQKNAWKLRRAAVKRKYLAAHLGADDVVICDSWKSVNAIPPHLGKLVILAHGQEYLKTGRRARRIQKALDRATHLIASSHYTLGLVENDWQTAHLQSTAIAPTYMLADDLPARTEKPLEPIRLVSVCRLEARKGLLQSLETLAALSDTMPDWRWDIGGSGPQADELKDCIARLGLGERVTMLGRVEEADKERLLAQADLFVMPSYQQGKSLEGYGITYVEAARFGVPAIAGVAGGAPEAVIDGKTGWCVDTLDATALRQTLSEALTQDDERQKRGAAARAHYVDKLTGSAVFASFMNHIS